MKSLNSRFLGFAAMSVAACIASMPAKASLVADGVTYSLTETTTANPSTDQFTLGISGINGSSDTEKGRYGVEALAFTTPTNFSFATFVSTTSTNPTGYSSMVGGLNSMGCDGSGGFFCFKANATPVAPALPAGSSLSYVFTVTTSAAGSFSGYVPDLKINWVGTNNNYDLVSQPITPTAVPLPAAAWLLLSGIAGMGAMARRRRLTTAA